ncbi:MAG: ABC transporter substrate-binding protein [bacterium]
MASYWEKLDKITWRFELRQGVTFHNNKKLTVQDVLYSFYRVWQNPQSEYRAFTWYVDTIYADDNAIIFKLKIPYAFFLYDIAGLFIVAEGFDAQKEIPIGTGPYRCIKLSAEEIKMEYYEHYWGGTVPIKYVRFIFIPDYKKRIEILNNGKADIINFIPLSAVSELNTNTQVVATPGNSIRYLEFNLAKYPFNQKKFREAINLAIDREYIARVIYKGYAVPANQYLPPGVLGFNHNLPQATYHPEQAKKFLQKIAGIPPIEIDCTAARSFIAQAIAQNLENIGMKIRVNILETAEYWNRLENQKSDCYLIASVPGSYEGIGMLRSSFHTYEPRKGLGMMNRINYSNRGVDSIIEGLFYLDNQEAVLQAMYRIQRILLNDLPKIPIVWEKEIYGISRRIIWKPRLDERIMIKEIRLKQPDKDELTEGKE